MILFIIIILIILAIIVAIIKNNRITDRFSNKYTNDSCCTEIEKENCMKYGKTGICNYNKNDKSCFCQNAYT